VARTPDLELKRELLDQVVQYLAEHGLGHMSLRPLAQALGTSPNRLVHHFGSKEELLVAALARATEIQVKLRERWLKRSPDMSQADQLRRWWKWVNASPANLALVRLGLEAASLEATVTGLPGDVRADQIGIWRSHIEHWLLQHGVSPEDASIEASIAKATFTGLMIDLMATGEKRRLTAALDVALARLDELTAHAALASAVPAVPAGAA
jgi:AcrR family transcriptional regulator